MNTQELFDKIACHLLTQSRRSRKEFVGCAYRGEGGLQCAIGCLIADEFYNEDLERRDAEEPEVVKAISASIGRSLNEDEAEMLGKLQYVHDTIEPVDWRRALAEIASDFGLDPSEVQEVPDGE